jgi:hypothetical protein
VAADVLYFQEVALSELFRNQQVASSILAGGSSRINYLGEVDSSFAAGSRFAAILMWL